jgi:ornithine carbamoyltransferase
MKHFLSINDLKSDQLTFLINKAIESKNSSQLKFSNLAENRILAMIFERPSTRTRLSFDVAMKHLGGSTITMNQQEMHVGQQKESIIDTARTLSQYVDIIMLRSKAHSSLQELSSAATIPVINGLSDLSHPCQVMADLMTIFEKKNRFANINIAWVGPITNVTHSWIEAINLDLGINFGIYTDQSYILKHNEKCKKYNYHLNLDKVKIIKNINEFDSVDVVLTDTWESMGENHNLEIFNNLKKYTVNQELMSLFKKDCIFMHCLPANRSQEVSNDVIDGPQSVVWSEAENRLHIQKEIIKWCL